MPRDGSGVYTKPYPSVVSGTTIESLVYNGQVDDVAQDLNTPRPISAGGTGASNAAGAAANLGVVTGKAVMTYTEAEKTQARSNIAAAPFDALAYSGMQVNGSMEVTQEKGVGVATTLNGAFICDGWRLSKDGTSVVSALVGVGAITPGLPQLISISVSTAVASLAANDVVAITQNIEGWRLARLAWGTASAQPITIGFWTAHHRAGLYTGAVVNKASNRAYGFTYTHSVADSAQYNTITIPGDTSGIWAIDNTEALRLSFAMASGSTYYTPVANTWGTSGNFAAVGQINGIAATSDVFRITGVVVLPGTEAPSAARSPLIMRPYDQELLTCQRHWWRGALCIATHQSYNGGNTRSSRVTFPVHMRTVPTLTFFDAAAVSGKISWADSAGTQANGFTPPTPTVSEGGFSFGAGGIGTTSIGSSLFSVNADARL